MSPTFAPQINDPFCIGVCVAGMDNLKLWNKNWGRIGNAGWCLMFFGLAGLAWVRLDLQAHAAILQNLFGWTFTLGTGCLLCYAAAPENPCVRWLCAPWLRWCGIISYEWYLFHQPMILWARELLGPASGSFFKYSLILGVPVVASLFFSALIYRMFSLPILKHGRSRKSAQK